MEPILRDFPDRFETERLTIRSPRPGDGPAMHVAQAASLDRLRPWFPWAGRDVTVEQVEVTMRQRALQFQAHEDLMLLLLLKGTDTIIGSSGLHRIDWSVPSFEIGYWVRTGYEGQGYVTEAVLGITDFAFETLGARRVEIRCDALNTRSAAVARRAGFQPEGHLRAYKRHHLSDELRDELIFARIRPEGDETS